jgi:hypothetical protein
LPGADVDGDAQVFMTGQRMSTVSPTRLPIHRRVVAVANGDTVTVLDASKSEQSASGCGVMPNHVLPCEWRRKIT